MSVWTTKDGEEIELTKLKNDHLSNIIKWIETKARNGFLEITGGGSCPDDYYYDETMLYGQEVLDYFNYTSLVLEQKRRF